MSDLKFKVMVDPIGYDHKPTTEEVLQIQIRLRDESCIKELSLEEILDYFGTGHTIVFGVFKGGAKYSNFISQQLIGLDYDNDIKKNKKNNYEILPLEQAVSNLRDKGIRVKAFYNTFHNTDNIPKYRLILALSEPVTDIKTMKFILNTLNNEIKQSDNACTNPNRLFYGTDSKTQKVAILDAEATVNIDDIIRLDANNTNNISTINYTADNDLIQLIKNFDLLGYMQQENEISHTSGDITYFKNCCICGHYDCLRYYKTTNSFYCFGSNGCQGGSIIDYLMITKILDRFEATKYFLYKILKLPKKQPANDNYLEIVKQQLKDNVIQLRNDIKDLPWVISYTNKKGILIEEIDCPKLYDFIKKNMYYIFVRSHAKGGVLRYFYIDGYYKLVSDDEVKGFIKSLIPLPLYKSSRINEVFNLLCTDLNFIDINMLNANENIINFENGCLDIKTGKLGPHSPDNLSTIKIHCNYVEDAVAPTTHYFDNYLNDLTKGNKEIQKLIIQGIGVVISNIKGWRFKKGFVMYGKGDVGKSQIKEFQAEMIGRENTCNIDLKELETTFGKFEILNKRLVGHNDMSFMSIPEVSVFKQACAGDQIHAQPKGQQAINFVFNGVLWFCANELPKFSGDRGQHVYDRIIPIKCDNYIPPEKRDKHLVEHLMEEAEYVCSIAIKALKEVIANNYTYSIPEICEHWKEEYKISNHSFLRFMDECVIERTGHGIDDECTCRKLYDVYREWCKINNNKGYHETKGEVFKILENMGKGERIKTNGGYWYFKDITLSDDTKKEYAYIYGSENKYNFSDDDYTPEDLDMSELLDEDLPF